MDEEALNYAHELFKKEGYVGNVNDFSSLVKSDKTALSHAHNLMKKNGYTGDVSDFSLLIGVGVKKKENSESTSTSGGTKSLLAGKKNSTSSQKNAKMKSLLDFDKSELDFSKIQKKEIPVVNKNLQKLRRYKLSKELSNVKVTPENMDEVSRKTDELSSLQKKDAEVKKQAFNRLENQFYIATKGEDDDSIAEQRTADAVARSGVWNKTKDLAKKTYNTLLKGVDYITQDDFYSKELSVSEDPLQDQKDAVIKQAIKNKEKLSGDEINKRAFKLYKEKEKENIFIDRANLFLENLDDKDRIMLRQDRASKVTHLKEDIAKKLKVVEALKAGAENKAERYLEIEKELKRLNAEKKPFPEGLHNEYTSLNYELKTIGSRLEKYHDDIFSNRENLGTAEQELDLFNRQYGDAYNLISKLGIGFKELGYNAIGAIDYLDTTISSVFGPNLVQQAKHIKTQSIIKEGKEDIEKERNMLRKPVENIESLNGFLNKISDMTSDNFVPIAVSSIGLGGIGLLGAAEAGRKYNEMSQDVISGKKKFDPITAALTPLFYGGTDFLLDGLPMYKMIKNGGRTFDAIMKQEANLIEKTMFDKGSVFVKSYTKATGEALSPMVAGQFFKNSFDIIALNEDKNVFEGMEQVVKDGLFLSTMMHSFPHLIGLGLKPFQSKNELRLLDENSRKIIEFSKQLEDPNITPVAKGILEKSIKELTDNSSSIINNTIDKLSNSSDEKVLAIMKITSESAELRAKAKEIYDSKVSNKKDLLNAISEEYKLLNEKRNGIIDGSITDVDLLPIKDQDKIKRQALESLTTELNPDGTKNIKITNEQISSKANEILAESRNNIKEKGNVADEAKQVVEKDKPSDIVEEKTIDKEEIASSEKQESDVLPKDNNKIVDDYVSLSDKESQLIESIKKEKNRRKSNADKMKLKEIQEQKNQLLESDEKIKFIDKNIDKIIKELERNGVGKPCKF